MFVLIAHHGYSGVRGDRWSELYEGDEGSLRPEIYGVPADSYGDDTNGTVWEKRGEPYAHIYYKDGRKVSLRRGSDNIEAGISPSQ